MTGEAPLSPSQVKKDGRWRPVRHKTSPSLRSTPSLSTPQRRSSLRAVLRRKPLSTITEDRAPSMKSNSTVSLRLNTAVNYQPPPWSQSSEHLLYFRPSQQLQNFQSVSFHCTGGAFECMPRLYRTQSQCTAPSSRSYESSDISSCCGPTLPAADATVELDFEAGQGSRGDAISPGEDLPREAIADLFHRVEKYEQEHPEVVRDSGKVWVRANSVGHGLTKTIKTMSALHKKPTFEARISHNVPVQSQLRVYEKPSCTERVKIAVHDCWRKFRNWSTGRDTELWADRHVAQHSYPTMNLSITSLTLPESNPAKRRFRLKKLSRAPEVDQIADDMLRAEKARRDSRFSTREQLRRRKSSMFLDS